MQTLAPYIALFFEVRRFGVTFAGGILRASISTVANVNESTEKSFKMRFIYTQDVHMGLKCNG